MRNLRPSFALRSSRFAAVSGAFALSLMAATASAAQPAAPAPSTTTTEVAAPSDGAVVVVSTTTTSAPAPAPAPAPVQATTPQVALTPTPAPVPAPVVDCERPPAVDRYEQLRSEKKAEKGRAVGLAAGGWSLLGSTYLVSALIGTVSIDVGDTHMRRFGSWMTLPVAGPFAAAFHSRSATGALFTTTLGLAQAAGFTMAVVGHRRIRRAKRDLQLMAMPTRGGGHVGLRMRF